MLLRDIRIQEPTPIQLRVYDALSLESLIEGYQAASYGNDECSRIEYNRLVNFLIPCIDMSYLRIKSVLNKNLPDCEIRFFPSRAGKPIVVCIDECEINKCN